MSSPSLPVYHVPSEESRRAALVYLHRRGLVWGTHSRSLEHDLTLLEHGGHGDWICLAPKGHYSMQYGGPRGEPPQVYDHPISRANSLAHFVSATKAFREGRT